MFGSSNIISSASINAKVAGLTDQSIKSDYLKNFTVTNTSSAQNIKL